MKKYTATLNMVFKKEIVIEANNPKEALKLMNDIVRKTDLIYFGPKELDGCFIDLQNEDGRFVAADCLYDSNSYDEDDDDEDEEECLYDELY